MSINTVGNSKYLKFLFLFAFLLLLGVVALSILNPSEKQKRDQDNNLEKQARLIINSLNRYYKDTGKMPWSAATGSQYASPSLPWTWVNSQQIGICKDENCANMGEVEITVATIEGKVNLTQQDKLYIGKGVNPLDPLYICFLPISQSRRTNTASLFQVDIDSKSSAPSKLNYCNDRTTWQDKDVCYICVSDQTK